MNEKQRVWLCGIIVGSVLTSLNIAAKTLPDASPAFIMVVVTVTVVVLGLYATAN